ncbi:GNAT family N-acetyltransferase [Rummeliibacillus pycnus]|uniref:GNAT family N-acetyltransferase n=1 Tax=Rummeliibacillus pycnus TaxID=101070 RepID=UPI0037C81BDB
MKISSLQEYPKIKVISFFIQHWGTTEMVISSGIYDCSQLDGYVFLNDQHEIIGLITYILRGEKCEIISLDSIEENHGIGTILVQEVEKTTLAKGCKLVTLITTNDNLHALKFYQKRGYHLTKVYPNAVQIARKYKPEIPLVGNDGIPIRDEIELQKVL